MLAAGAAGESREEILRALDFGKFLEDAKKVEKPFKAYKKMIDELSSVTNDGYTLDIGKTLCMPWIRAMISKTVKNIVVQ